MKKLKKYVLVLNCGSSSVKFGVICPSDGSQYCSGLAEKLGTNNAQLKWTIDQHTQQQPLLSGDYQTALSTVMTVLVDQLQIQEKIFAVGHRVVHGGEKFKYSVMIDDKVIEAIAECVPLAPLHNPANLLGIQVAQQFFTLPQIAVFDTAFHQTLPDYAYLYAVPFEWYQHYHIRRYGFHGTSHRYLSEQMTKRLSENKKPHGIITAHLGNGCSLAAICEGKSIDTSMGLTPLEGLVMGTRSGDVDPGLHAHCINTLKMTMNEVDHVLNKESGLLGISGVSMDMRSLNEAAVNGNVRAQLSIEMFCYRLAKYIAGFIVPLGKLDALVFSGGIGENDFQVRAKTLQWLKPFGFIVDDQRNKNHGENQHGLISSDNSIAAYVIKTNEELMIARDAAEIVRKI